VSSQAVKQWETAIFSKPEDLENSVRLRVRRLVRYQYQTIFRGFHAGVYRLDFSRVSMGWIGRLHRTGERQANQVSCFDQSTGNGSSAVLRSRPAGGVPASTASISFGESRVMRTIRAR